jgi:hypothetical protein
MHAIAAGVTTRRYSGTVEELPEGERLSSTSKGAVSRRFVAVSTAHFEKWLSRRGTCKSGLIDSQVCRSRNGATCSSNQAKTRAAVDRLLHHSTIRESKRLPKSTQVDPRPC